MQTRRRIFNSSIKMAEPFSSGTSSFTAVASSSGSRNSGSRFRKKRSMDDLRSHIEGIIKPRKSKKPMRPHTKVSSYDASGRIFHGYPGRKTEGKEKKRNSVKKEVSSPFLRNDDFANATDASHPAEEAYYDDENNEVIEECRHIVPVDKLRWSERQTISHEKWEECRGLITEAMLREQFLEEPLCSQCKTSPPFISCQQCKSLGPICGACDQLIHRRLPFHDRLLWKYGSFRYIPPTLSINDVGKTTQIKRFVTLKPPKCQGCGEWIDKTCLKVTTQKCIVVNLQGRYDLFQHLYECVNCKNDVDPFVPTILMQSRYWPGSLSNISYLFDEDLLIFWDKLKSFMPGTSEAAFLKSLEDISRDRNRQGTINKTAFSQCYREWKYCQMRLGEMQMKNMFECPCCSIEQHASHVDGNCKVYRYKGSGMRRRPSYYGNIFMCDNEEVDNALQKLYGDPNIGRMPDVESGLCGSTYWKAAQDRSRKFVKLDETGILMMSCRHRIAQKALNMFRGELFGYSYFLHKNHLAQRGVTIAYSDVACKYSKWVQKVDPDLYEKGKFAIGMMHVKGHPAHCEILFGGLWAEGAGFTSGEEDEQIFSYLSRIGATTKYMLPERREETITEHAAAWNKRKLDNFVSDLQKRYDNVLEKRSKVKEDIKQQLASCDTPITARDYQRWKDEAILNAEVAQNCTMSVMVSEDEELVMLYMLLKEKDQLPDNVEHICAAVGVVPLKIAALRLRPLSKSLTTLQKKYCTLNEKYSNNSSVVSDNLANMYRKIFSCHQRRLEATAYTVIHLTNSLSRIADSSKKRKKLRLKISKQSEILKTHVALYNDNAEKGAVSDIRPVSLLSSLRDSFPWRQITCNETSVPSELRQSLLVLNVTLTRLTEELSIIKSEMRNYISYFEEKLKDLLKQLKELTDRLADDSSEDIAGLEEDETEYSTSEKTDDILKGQIALVH